MARKWMKERFAIMVIDHLHQTKHLYKDIELREMLSGFSDIRKNPFWQALFTKDIEFEKEEDYKLLGLHFPVEDWDIYYNLHRI